MASPTEILITTSTETVVSSSSSTDILMASAGEQAGVTVDLFRALTASNDLASGSNAVMSPISIVAALAMAAAGARGATLSEMAKVLRLPEGDKLHKFVSQVISFVLADGSDAGGPMVSSAGGVWVEQSLALKANFQELLRREHGAEIRQANFVSKPNDERVAINSWILEKTKGKIENLLQSDSVSSDTRMILANALYFKAAWRKTFNEEDTVTETFFLLDGKTVEVPYLATRKKMYIEEYDTHAILKLPYESGNESHRSFSMYIVLPNKRGGLPELEKSLSAEILAGHCSPDGVRREVDVGRIRVPKFKFSTKFSAVDALVNMGLKAPFAGKAEFFDIVEESTGAPLYIDNVFQKAFVEVNEKGTEAAAATGIEIMLMCYVPPTSFEANHPFLFVIKEDVSGMILFVGRITDPSMSD